MEISIKVEGIEKLDSALQKMVLGCHDFRPYWKDVQKEFFEIEKRQFDSEGAKGRSGKWKPLSPKYAAIKQKQYGSKPILQRETDLYKSLTRNTGDTIFNPKKESVELGTSTPYAMAHQKPKKKGRVKREPISITDEQAKQLLMPIKKGLEKLAESLKLK